MGAIVKGWHYTQAMTLARVFHALHDIPGAGGGKTTDPNQARKQWRPLYWLRLIHTSALAD